MADRSQSPSETPEQAEARRRAATARRIKVLIGLSVLVLGARFIVRDPKKRAPVDYTKMQTLKIVPGMLDTLPAATRAQLDPQIVAKMVLADEMARRGEYGKPAEDTKTAAVPYKPMDAPAEADLEAETYKEQIFAYARRRRIITEQQRRIEQQALDLSNSTLVQFRSGGYLLAETAQKGSADTYIRMSKAVRAEIPNRWVSSIQNDARGWEEPVPAGQVRLTPAKGITVILHRDTASRITIEKTKFDEI
jgi:hypothetical protein